MATTGVPDGLELERHRDWQGRSVEFLLPRVGLVIFAAVPVLALFNVFGQRPDFQTVANPNGAATMSLSAPTKVRGGLLFQARFDIHAKHELKDAVLVFERGWSESMTFNTIEPGASSETSKDGKLTFDIGDIPAGKTWTQYLQFQANPVNMGSQSEGVSLYDGDVPILHMNRDIMVWP